MSPVIAADFSFVYMPVCPVDDFGAMNSAFAPPSHQRKPRLAAALSLALVLAGSVLLASCGKKVSPVVTFNSPSPGLGTMQRYIGRLAVDRGCLVIRIGGDAVTGGNSAQIVAIPLLGPGFKTGEVSGAFALTAPDGAKFAAGDVVSGEGAPYPAPSEPGSAPVAPPPDTAKCPGQPYQINSMHAFSG